jgi:hypothetical protein
MNDWLDDWLATAPWNKILIEMLTTIQLVNKFPAFCEDRRLITLSRVHEMDRYMPV